MKLFNLFRKKKYYLSDEEKIIFDNIKLKANLGYNEWIVQTKGNDICGPWIKDIQPDEVNLLDKIHKVFYGNKWHIVLPLGVSQCYYIEYEDIKDKVDYDIRRI